MTTDFAKASGALQSSTAGNGGWWWLRSPNYDNDYIMFNVFSEGTATSTPIQAEVRNSFNGVVPALCLE